MYKPASQYFAAFLILLTLPAASYSQSSYQVEYTAEFSRAKETIDKQKQIALGAEIFFDEVATNSHPYAEAAFLEHASSLAISYADFEFTSTIFGLDGNSSALFVNYVVPNSLLIFQAGYIVSDGDVKNGSSGTIDADTFLIGIGKHINDHSAIIVNYSQQDSDIDIIPLSTTSVKDTAIGIKYKLVEKLQDSAAFNVEAAITSSEVERNATSESNTIIEFSGDYYQNQSISVGASVAINSGDDKAIEGKTLGLNIRMFLTPAFAAYVGFNQFSADNTSGEDLDEIVLGATARF